jgi:hypothetical protein
MGYPLGRAKNRDFLRFLQADGCKIDSSNVIRGHVRNRSQPVVDRGKLEYLKI